MKRTILVVALLGTMISCKKETTTPATSGNTNTTVDTTTQTVESPLINTLDCSSAAVTGTLKKGEVANAVSVKLNYTGGNGKAFTAQAIASTNVTGLTAKLNAGALATGDGTVTYLIIGTPETTGTANFAINLCGKSCSFSLDVEAPTSGYGPTITDVDGNTYKTVYIGTQQWMAENLKTAKYSDGTTIPNVIDNTQWKNNTTGAWAYHNNDAANNLKYGKLYNWYAVSKTRNGNKNVCPTGWHVPTDAEWTVLTGYLGGESIAGGKMKEVGTTNWNSPNTDATNTSLFSALPGGMRGDDGNYSLIGDDGYWWSSTMVGNYSTDQAWTHCLNGYFGGAIRSYSLNRAGLSVRCLRD
jgi:uncharacterized protein (TIGR02145 family)